MYRHKQPNYISQADLEEKDVDELAVDILMRMTPKQLETRCTHNVVYCLFDEQQQRNPLWNKPAVLSLLGRGPKFIPKARSLSLGEVRDACARLNYRLVQSFKRFVEQREHILSRCKRSCWNTRLET